MSQELESGQTIYFLRFPGRWGHGEYLCTEGNRALVMVWIEGGEELRWLPLSGLKNKREAARAAARSERPASP